MSENSKYTDLRNKITNLREAATKEAQNAFKEGTNSIFEKYPKLENFSWNQYTPYFNDGDTCHFSAHTDYINLSYAGESTSTEDFDEDNKELDKVYDEIHEFLAVFEEEDYLAMFGDHVEVTVSRNEVSTSEHDHD